MLVVQGTACARRSFRVEPAAQMSTTFPLESTKRNAARWKGACGGVATQWRTIIRGEGSGKPVHAVRVMGELTCEERSPHACVRRAAEETALNTEQLARRYTAWGVETVFERVDDSQRACTAWRIASPGAMGRYTVVEEEGTEGKGNGSITVKGEGRWNAHNDTKIRDRLREGRGDCCASGQTSIELFRECSDKRCNGSVTVARHYVGDPPTRSRPSLLRNAYGKMELRTCGWRCGRGQYGRWEGESVGGRLASRCPVLSCWEEYGSRAVLIESFYEKQRRNKGIWKSS
uniref:Uncharacterized protein n=1 Tax=Setaria digitata TaxID=48799 RepID=A0A915PBT7_9BILA